jgi:hypothetical protein
MTPAGTRAAAEATDGCPAGVPLATVLAAVEGVALWCPDVTLPVTGVVAADLMSDVLVDARPGYVLVTGLVNVQVIRTAAIADLAAVVFARGKEVPAEVVELARQMNVPSFASRESLFEAAGRLYAALGGGPAGSAGHRRA